MSAWYSWFNMLVGLVVIINPLMGVSAFATLAFRCLARQSGNGSTRATEDFVDIHRRTGSFEPTDHAMNFRVRDERAVHANRHRSTRLQEQHVAMAEELLSVESLDSDGIKAIIAANVN